MPAYSTTNVSAVYRGDAVIVWAAETPASGAFSQQVAIGPAPDGNPPYCSVEVSFSGNPGAGWEIDIQESDTDSSGNYVGPLGGAITTAKNVAGSTYVARVDLMHTPWVFGGSVCRKMGFGNQLWL